MTYPDKSDVSELKVWIPSDGEEHLTHIIIEAFLLNPEDVDGDIHLFVNKGNTPPSSDNADFFSEEIWFNGLGVLVEKEEM